jgi:hypothetical protein
VPLSPLFLIRRAIEDLQHLQSMLQVLATILDDVTVHSLNGAAQIIDQQPYRITTKPAGEASCTASLR